MNSMHIFYDPTGRRKRALSWSAAILATLFTISTVLFVVSLIISPFLPSPEDVLEPSNRLTATQIPQRKKQLSSYLLKKAKTDLEREVAETNHIAKKQLASKNAPDNRIIAGFYSTWEEAGLQSLRANVKKITHLIPEWIHLTETGDGINLDDWKYSVVPENQEVLAIARDYKLQIHPRFNNAQNGELDPKRLHLLLSSPIKQKKVARAIKAWLLQQNFQGINIDFQNIEPHDAARLPGFIQVVRDEFANSGLAISIDVPAYARNFPLKRLGDLCDFVVMFGFGEHFSSGSAGPLASLTWFANSLQELAQSVTPNKIVIALSNHGISWKEPVKVPEGEQKTAASVGETLSYLSTLNRAREFLHKEDPTQVIAFDPISLNPYFTFINAEGVRETIWFLDAANSYNQWLMASRAAVRGAAVWTLGSEDPSLWSFLDPAPGPNPGPEQLTQIKFPYQVDFEGKGEILEARFEPKLGQRKILTDSKTGIISNLEYLEFPSPVVIQRSGYKEKLIALTFDDGPSEEYTNSILDILKTHHVKATFFVIGQHAQDYPHLLRRIWREGHEIGNHTYTHPDMSAVSEQRRILELNTTQRVLQSLIGRSTILYRTPYRADIEPRSVEEVKAIQTASKLNYVTVGMTIDPQDWNQWRLNPDGTRTPLSGENLTQGIIQDVIAGVERHEGNVVLLHDGGGDRSATVLALPGIIQELTKRGYQLAKISELLNMNTAKIMPPINSKDQMLVGLNRIVFEVFFGFQYFLGLAFTIVLITGVARLLFVTSLALVARLKERYDDFDPEFRPKVSAIVAAYNEKTVISRTIQSLLNSDYRNLEVIVVDDGSNDGTSQEVQEDFGKNPLVKLITQENTGKAGALNHGIEIATTDILVCLDADTQLASDAISKMVRHFNDTSVGAVAGNVKVGNRNNMLTQWQSIEYISSQNLDRQAYSLLNAITVVPGAAGTWRKSAVLAAGGFTRDTLAEDMDLTWRIRRLGFTVTTESNAYGYTEAPDTVRSLFKQRFRWSFGSLQCLWKHRSALFHYGWFGWLGLPTLWIFQFGAQVLAPIVDLQLLYSLGHLVFSFFTESSFSQDWQPYSEVLESVVRIGALYVGLFTIDLISSIIAFKLDREPIKPLWLLFFQRFAYRQLMYAVVWKAVWMALIGLRQGWGKLQRTGTVTLPPESKITAS